MSAAMRVQLSIEDRAAELLGRINYRLMQSDQDREDIYRLRYRAYMHERAILPNAEQRTTDKFDDAANSWIFGIFFEGVLTSSIRVTVASPQYPTSPSADVFPEILGPELARGKIIVDPTRFVADPVRHKVLPELPYLTVRLGYVACGYFGADIGLATVRDEHQAFYRRVFLQKTLAPARMFPGLTKPVCLMAAHYPSVRERIYQRYPYFRSTEMERRALFSEPMTARRAALAASHSDGAAISL